MPIPKGLKVKNKPGSFSGGEDEDSQFGEDDYGIDEDDTMDSNSSSANQNQVRSIRYLCFCDVGMTISYTERMRKVDGLTQLLCGVH